MYQSTEATTVHHVKHMWQCRWELYNHRMLHDGGNDDQMNDIPPYFI